MLERLLDQLDPGLDQGRQDLFQGVGGEALVGVDADPDVGPRGAHGPDPLGVELGLAGQLQLDAPWPARSRARPGPSPPDRSAPRVKVVSSGRGASSPASRQTGTPEPRLSSSQRAQSSALRAPPGGSRSRRSTRLAPASTVLADRLDPLDHARAARRRDSRRPPPRRGLPGRRRPGSPTTTGTSVKVNPEIRNGAFSCRFSTAASRVTRGRGSDTQVSVAGEKDRARPPDEPGPRSAQ